MARRQEFFIENFMDQILEWTDPTDVKDEKDICITKREVAKKIGISHDAFHKAVKKIKDSKDENDQELHDALKEMEDNFEIWWTRKGLAKGVNTVGWIICVKNILKWKDNPADNEGIKERLTINYVRRNKDDKINNS